MKLAVLFANKFQYSEEVKVVTVGTVFQVGDGISYLRSWKVMAGEL
jgi:hypothetical protein